MEEGPGRSCLRIFIFFVNNEAELPAEGGGRRTYLEAKTRLNRWKVAPVQREKRQENLVVG